MINTKLGAWFPRIYLQLVTSPFHRLLEKTELFLYISFILSPNRFFQILSSGKPSPTVLHRRRRRLYFLILWEPSKAPSKPPRFSQSFAPNWMADGKNHRMGKKTQNNIKTNSSAVFNRSLTVNSSAAAAAAAENKPLFNICNSQVFQRNGSVKSLQGSTFGSRLSSSNSFKGKVRKLYSIFESPKHNSSTTFNAQSSPSPSPKSSKPDQSSLDSSIRLPGADDSVVIFFTSLRGIRRTFQDCHSVRLIFRGFRINIDERDISLNAAYRTELQKVVGENNVSLPQVFIKGKYIGGADPVIKLLESGELAKMIKGIPLRSLKPCDGCDDARFIPCLNCSGSRKVFDEDKEQSNRCPECNENGLMHCPLC